MANLTATPSGNHLPGVRSNSEKKLGIIHYTAYVDFAWIGDIRKRYTDFIVHEVRRDGTVVYLQQLDSAAQKERQRPERTENRAVSRPAPAPVTPEITEVAELSQELVDALEALVGPQVSGEMQDIYKTLVGGGSVPKTKIQIAISFDRTQRGHIHQEIRRIFTGRFETQADPTSGVITAQPAAGSKQRGGGRNMSRPNWRDNRGSRQAEHSPQNNRGKFLHFTLYKENKDTMDAINYLARMLKIKSANFGFAGTKDRRAATTQRVSVFHHGNVDLSWLNSKNNNVKVGDFSYHQSPIQLGQHGGNEFVIAVKNVELTRGMNCSLTHRLQMAENCVQQALDHIQKNGFINYFGLQRFGTHAIGTQEVGIKILSNDFEGACDYILYVDPNLISRLHDRDLEAHYHRDEINRARAIAMFRTSGDINSVLQTLPKRFGAEMTILQHLSRSPESRRDFCGALLKITRGLRNLYIHSYQSLVWNWVTSRRWSRYGNHVVAGDLILVESEVNPARYRQGEDMSEDLNQEEEQFYQEARVLTAEDAASGKYTIFDVVLPVPGFDVLYPENEIGEFYVEFMGRPENGGLNPYRMRRHQKEFSLSGHYRKIMARFTTVPKFFVRPYMDDAEQMHPTDMDEIRALKDEGKQMNAALRTASGATATTSSHQSTGSNTSSADKGDDGVSDSGDKNRRRRRLTPDRPQGSPETRINDAWVENKSDGGSKRVKIDSVLPPMEHINENQPPAGAVPTTPAVPNKHQSELLQANAKGAEDDEQPPSMEDVSRLFDQDQGSSPIQGTKSPKSETGGTGMSVPMTIPPLHHIQNVFKSVPEDVSKLGANDGSSAINLTDAWRHGVPALDDVDEMKIAVVLNFRLSASNYATICLREMMSSSFTGTADTAAAGGAGDPGHHGQVLGHGGHVHHVNNTSNSQAGLPPANGHPFRPPQQRQPSP